MKKILYGLMVLALTSMSAMEFGSAGYNTGTGVANKESVYSQYYNPALTALSSKKTSIGLGVEESLKAKSLYEILQSSSIDSADLSLRIIGSAVVGFNTSLGAIFTGLNARTEGRLGFKKSANNKGFDGFSENLIILEIPISYAYAFDLHQFGKLSIGLTGKYLLGTMTHFNVHLEEDFKFIEAVGLVDPFKIGERRHNFTLDLGVAYNVGILTVGIVGKNLTAPTFDYGTMKATIDPQARAGVALDWGILHASIDADLTRNKNIFDKNIKEQIIAASMGLGGNWIRADFGVEADIANNNNLYYLFGLRLGVLDLTAKISDQMTRVKGVKVPNDWKFGTGISFRL